MANTHNRKSVRLVFIRSILMVLALAPVLAFSGVKLDKPTDWLTLDRKTAQQAQQLFLQHRAVQAQAMLRDFIERYPESKWSRISYINFLLQQQLWDLAYDQIDIALKTKNNDRDFIKLHVRWHLRRRSFDQAYHLLAKHNPLNFQAKSDTEAIAVTAVLDPEFIALQAALSHKLKRFSDAAYLYEQLLEIEPLQFSYWLGLAVALDALQQTEKAYYAYTSALNMVSVNELDTQPLGSNRILWRYAAKRRHQLKLGMARRVN